MTVNSADKFRLSWPFRLSWRGIGVGHRVRAAHSDIPDDGGQDRYSREPEPRPLAEILVEHDTHEGPEGKGRGVHRQQPAEVSCAQVRGGYRAGVREHRRHADEVRDRPDQRAGDEHERNHRDPVDTVTERE